MLKLAMSRRRKNFIIAAVILFAGALAVLDRLFEDKLRQQTLFRIRYVKGAAKYHLKTFKVVNVVDGDTLDIDIPDGKYKTTRIRLLGVNTPETKNADEEITYSGLKATAFTKENTLGKNVVIIIDTVSGLRDRYGRLLAYVQLADGRILNEEIIKKGKGYADLRFRHGDFYKYAELQDKAIAGKTGLWKNVKRHQLPEWLKGRGPLLYP